MKSHIEPLRPISKVCPICGKNIVTMFVGNDDNLIYEYLFLCEFCRKQGEGLYLPQPIEEPDVTSIL